MDRPPLVVYEWEMVGQRSIDWRFRLMGSMYKWAVANMYVEILVPVHR